MEKIADLLTKFMISESSSENLDYEVCKFGLLMAIEVAINTVIALCISFLLGMFRYGILFLTFFSLLRAFAGGVHSFDGKVKKDRHGHLISMKSDLTRYGLGLALIEKSVNKYNGLLNFDIDEENFTLTVLLYS